jgi:hydroxyacylglutathione hydrolase
MRIHRIPAWLADTNCWVIATDDGRAVLVDAPPDPDRIGGHLADLDLTVSAIVLTHGHIDHTGGAGRLAEAHRAVTYVHAADDFLTLHPIEQLETMWGMIPEGSYELPERIDNIAHGQVLALGDVALEVRHTPGHTPGHCCFYWEQEGILFTGDQLFAGSVGRTDFPRGSWDDLMDSMRHQVMTLPDDVEVLPGHGPETTIGQERSTNPFRGDWS